MGYSGARGTPIYEKKPVGENLVSDSKLGKVTSFINGYFVKLLCQN